MEFTTTTIQDYWTELKKEWREIRKKRHVVIVQLASSIIFCAIPILFLNFILSFVIGNLTLRLAASFLSVTLLVIIYQGVKRILPTKMTGLLSGKFIRDVDSYKDAVVINVVLIFFLVVLIIGKSIFGSYVPKRETE